MKTPYLNPKDSAYFESQNMNSHPLTDFLYPLRGIDTIDIGEIIVVTMNLSSEGCQKCQK